MRPELNDTKEKIKLITEDLLDQGHRKIVIGGAFCSGKTTLCMYLGDVLRVHAVDLDDLTNGHKSAGSEFRVREKESLETLLKTQEQVITSLGGGTLTNYDTHRLLDGIPVIILEFPFEKVVSNLRIGDNLKRRMFLPQNLNDPKDYEKLKTMYFDRINAQNSDYFKKRELVFKVKD